MRGFPHRRANLVMQSRFSMKINGLDECVRTVAHTWHKDERSLAGRPFVQGRRVRNEKGCDVLSATVPGVCHGPIGDPAGEWTLTRGS